MRAIVCTKYGPPEVLQLRDIPIPTPLPTQIRVKIHATTVTSGDGRIRSFNVPPMFWLMGRLALGVIKPRNPILGREMAGVVDAVGEAVTRYKVGDPVFGLLGDGAGGYAEYVCLPEEAWLAPKPSNSSFEQAAAIAFGGITALRFLKQGNIQAGQTVLIYGASGAVGTYAVQLARYFGADVTAVCGPHNREMVMALGANRVLDYTTDDFTKGSTTYDIVFDAVGKTTFAQSQRVIKAGGVYLHDVMVSAGIKAPWYKWRTGKTVVGGSAADLTATPIVDDLLFLKGLIEAGTVKPVIDRSYPLEQIVEAHRYADTGHKKGNLVITLMPSTPQGANA